MKIKNSRPRKSDTRSGTSEPQLHTSLYLGLISATLQDVASVCNYPDAEREQDYKEICNRTRSEGICFLTKTLPSFAKAVDLALATDTQLAVPAFKRAKGSVLPRFLLEITSRVFDLDGWERSDASPLALRSLRQIGYLFYKLQLPMDEKLADETIKKFTNTDNSLGFNPEILSHHDKSILRGAKMLISSVLAPVDPYDKNLFLPRHGPGSVATGEKPWQKPHFKRYYKALALKFPYEEYFYYNSTHLCDSLQEFMSLAEIEAGTAKVVLVPKDSRGPRLISCEPLEYQWIQQGLMNVMVKTIEHHPLTAGHVNFTDQAVNRKLALQSSRTGDMATLDMKDASDRVSLALVRALFPLPWFEALLACRSVATRLPNGDIVSLKKFAPMGSAVCFPVEALIFWALSVSAITYRNQSTRVIDTTDSTVTSRSLLYKRARPFDLARQKALESVYVYGDDIICDIEDQDIVRQHLPKFELEFNDRKCCVGRSFRESCGCDAFKGVDVTPLKISTTWCPSLPGTTVVSWAAYHNAFNARGYFHSCDYLAKAILQERIIPYEDLRPHTGLVALVDCRKMAVQENKKLGIQSRFCPDCHRLEYRSWVVRPRIKNAWVQGWAEMLRIASYMPSSKRSDASQEDIRPAPWVSVTDPAFWGDISEPTRVKAYRYTLPRQVILRRGWGCSNNSRS
jgi:hypothetical protein